jgi:hypothetical protein
MNKLTDLNPFVKSLYVFMLLLVVSPTILFGQAKENAFERDLKIKLDSLRKEKEVGLAFTGILLPNNAVASVMTPTGWGGGNTTYLYFVAGAVFPVEYATTNRGDMITAVGLSFGDSRKYVNASVSVNMGRVDDFRDFSGNIIISKQVFRASSISVGGIQLFASAAVSDAPDPTFYVAFSHSVQTVTSKSSGHSALGYTIGIGNGRFLYKSPLDNASGKGRYGTGVFANVSYELFRNVNINAEWSGLNLGISSGIRPFNKLPLTVGYGVYNLTRNSGDRVSFLGTVDYPFILDKKNKQVKSKI